MNLTRLTLLFFTLFSFTFSQAKDFIQYNQFINKAELAIVDGNYGAALKLYDAAFLIDSVSYAQDLYNASICAIKQGQLQKGLYFCFKLANRGVGDSFYVRKSIYEPLRELKEWDGLLRVAKNKRNDFKQRNSTHLRIIDSLVKKDQDMNHKWRASGMNPDVERLMDMTNDTIASALHNLLIKEGFLSEKVLGAMPMSEDDIYLRTPFDVIMIHNYESRRIGDSLFNDVLYNALYDGLIKPDYYAYIRDFAGGNNSLSYFGSIHLFVQYNCKIYKNKYADLKTIEQMRARIGLGTLEDYAKKLTYVIDNKNSDFIINGQCGKIMNFKNSSSEEMFYQHNDVFVDKIEGCL